MIKKKINAPMPFKKAMLEMHKADVRLIQQHERGEVAWYLTSGSRVTCDTAAKIREAPNVEGGADALFPGHHQTWRVIPRRTPNKKEHKTMKYDSDEYRKLMQERIAAGKLIDPKTAEMTWWYGNIPNDVYNDGIEGAKETEHNIGRIYAVRAPNGIWVETGDLPEEISREVKRLRDEGFYDKAPDPSHHAEALALVDCAVTGLIESMDGIDFHTLNDFNKAIDGAVDECKANRLRRNSDRPSNFRKSRD
jgi:hypothetical protein